MKHIILVLGLSWLLASSLLAVVTFMMAYFSYDKAITVYINHFHEAHIEFIMILILLPISLIFSWRAINELK